MTRKVTLVWSDPCSIYAELPDCADERGLYQVTRLWGERESLLYIGIVHSSGRTLRQRWREHTESWLLGTRGIQFRFATLHPGRGPWLERETFEEVEGALIGELQPPENTSKKSYYSIRRDILIVSQGNKGLVPPVLSTAKHPWK